MGAALALLASAAWGVSDFVSGLTARRVPLLAVLLVSQPVGLIVIVALAVARGGHGLGGLGTLYAALAGIAGTIGLAAFYRALAIGTMGIVAPISATSPAVPVVVGIVRGERPSTAQGLGIGLAIVGIVLASRESGPREKRARVAAGALLALFAALCFGSALLSLDAASSRDPYLAVLGLRLASTIFVFGWFAATRPRLVVPRSSLWLLALAGLLDSSGAALFAVASTESLVSLAAVLASLYPIVIIVLARTVLRERVGRSQLVGAAGALAGAALISAG